jgi:hypothetical protein
MVPLRFITENFGADVGWDEATRAVTVVKEAFTGSAVNIEDVLRRSSLPMMGDSNLGWSIRRTPGAETFFRSFDGRLNTFVLSENAILEVDFFDNSREDTLETIQVLEMESARKNTPMGQSTDKTKSGVEFVKTQFRDSVEFVERRAFVLEERILVVMLSVRMSAGIRERNDYIAILDTFDLVFNPENTEDLSNVNDGMRLFECNEFNIELRLPADWRRQNHDNRVNYFEFVTTHGDGASLEILSRQGDDSAEKWASEVRQNAIENYNPRTYSYGALRTMQIGGVTAHYYRATGSFADDEFVGVSAFWQYGEYMYNLRVSVGKDDESVIKDILDSVSFKAIDSNAVGILFREPVEPIANTVFSSVTNTSVGFTVDIPVTWRRVGSNTLFISDSQISVNISFFENEKFNRDSANLVSQMLVENNGMEIVREATTIARANLSSNSLSGYTFEAKSETIYIIYYLIISGNNSFVITASIPDHLHSPANRAIIERIIKSFVVS